MKEDKITDEIQEEKERIRFIKTILKQQIELTTLRCQVLSKAIRLVKMIDKSDKDRQR